MASSGAVPHCRFWRLARPLFHVPMLVWSGPLSANSVSPLLLLKWKCGGHAWLTLSPSKLTSFSRDTDWSPSLSRACVHHWLITSRCIKYVELADKIKGSYLQQVTKEICTYQSLRILIEGSRKLNCLKKIVYLYGKRNQKGKYHTIQVRLHKCELLNMKLCMCMHVYVHTYM